MSDFDSAKFYAVGDVELLEHESPYDAIAEYLDECHPMVVDGAVTVEAYVPEQVQAAWANQAARRCVDQISEDLSEEYGNPEGEPQWIFSSNGHVELEERIRNAIQHAIDCHAHVWTCRKVGQREYSRDEVKALYAEMFDEEPSR